MGVRMKLNPLRDDIEGKRLVVIDDSIVRGTTMVQLVKMLRNAGAKEIHIRINSPEVIWPCFYGIDTDVQSQLISANKTVDEICEYIGADSLAFLSVEGLLKVMPKGGYCDACFTGRYPWRFPRALAATSLWRALSPATWTSRCSLTTTPWSRNTTTAVGKRSTARPKTCHVGTGIFW